MPVEFVGREARRGDTGVLGVPQSGVEGRRGWRVPVAGLAHGSWQEEEGDEKVEEEEEEEEVVVAERGRSERERRRRRWWWW